MKRLASTLVGLASSVTSQFGSTLQFAAIESRMPATVPGFISEGVPPPKKIEDTVRPLVSAARWISSERKAETKRSSSTAWARTWLLKSQYGHFDWQNGQCT